MHIHILGICGTFMGSLAVIAQQKGLQVTGSDTNVYPPMSTQLQQQGIELYEGYTAETIKQLQPDMVVIGNAMSRGNPAVEYVLASTIPYVSGPQWLAQEVLHDRWVLAVAGTHGKTTTTSMLAWILEYANLKPGFLIGGVASNFPVSARLGEAPFFVIEADEYDSAFFDKRSKFIHYHPHTVILNNLEFDHADIFPDLAAIKQQFHYLLRTVPNNGLVIKGDDANLTDVVNQGCWTPVATINKDWQAVNVNADGSEFDVMLAGEKVGHVAWSLMGKHNVSNALAALAAARHAGVKIEHGIAALAEFKGVKRRMEILGNVNGITVYDDFAHHPSAIATTLAGLRARVGKAKIIVALEFASYTMRHGVHSERLVDALAAADQVFLQIPADQEWDLDKLVEQFNKPVHVCQQVAEIISGITQLAHSGDQIVIMSNRGFDGIQQKLLQGI